MRRRPVVGFAATDNAGCARFIASSTAAGKGGGPLIIGVDERWRPGVDESRRRSNSRAAVAVVTSSPRMGCIQLCLSLRHDRVPLGPNGFSDFTELPLTGDSILDYRFQK